MGVKRARAQQTASNERRKRGTCIKKGLDELGDLDFALNPTTGKATTKTNSTKVTSITNHTATTTGSSSTMVGTNPLTDAVKIDTENDMAFHSTPISSSCSPAASVFGHGWEEWRHVKHLLFHSDGNKSVTQGRRIALDRIQHLWQARGRKHRPFPAYVESTALLLEAVSLDEEDKLSSSAAVVFYGAAISRAVHLMTGTFARGEDDTYRKRARAIGFPEEAVEVRQRVAHGALPLLSELRWVCGLVLQFLFQHYWLEQERHVRLMEEEDEEEEVQKKEKGVNTNVLQQRECPPTSTVEEMRQLLEELGSTSEEEEGGTDEKPIGDAPNVAEIVQDGWKLL
ncbi:Las1-like [Trypanosoma melophagium]|uniref:Las1-like n=1 Tax=Trypanosoma melophagium TaxID=715481 RepID=UPI00351A3FDA|nr:Las1-like [Trypanosoma melophagium]